MPLRHDARALRLSAAYDVLYAREYSARHDAAAVAAAAALRATLIEECARFRHAVTRYFERRYAAYGAVMPHGALRLFPPDRSPSLHVISPETMRFFMPDAAAASFTLIYYFAAAADAFALFISFTIRLPPHFFSLYAAFRDAFTPLCFSLFIFDALRFHFIYFYFMLLYIC